MSIYIGKNLPHAKREAQARATAQGRPWYVYGSEASGYRIDPTYYDGKEATMQGPPLHAARPQGWGGSAICKCGHNGYQHRNGGRCLGGHSMCRCASFRDLREGP